VAQLFSLGSIRTMKAQTFALFTFVVGILATSYFGWALYRLSDVAMGHFSRSWPYPDRLLIYWDGRLDAAYPAPPGFIKLDGEWQSLQICLYILIGLTGLIAFCGLIWLIYMRKDDHAA
jgi:hypothetical protein